MRLAAADARRDRALARLGWRVVRLPAALVLSRPHEAVALVRWTLVGLSPLTSPVRAQRAAREHGLGVAPGMGAEKEVQVLLEPLQRLKAELNELTPRNWGQSLDDCAFRPS